MENMILGWVDVGVLSIFIMISGMCRYVDTTRGAVLAAINSGNISKRYLMRGTLSNWERMDLELKRYLCKRLGVSLIYVEYAYNKMNEKEMGVEKWIMRWF